MNTVCKIYALFIMRKCHWNMHVYKIIFKKARFILNDVDIDLASSKDKPLLDKEWNYVYRGITNFNDFEDVDENLITAEMRCIQEIAVEIQGDANAD